MLYDPLSTPILQQLLTVSVFNVHYQSIFFFFGLSSHFGSLILVLQEILQERVIRTIFPEFFPVNNNLSKPIILKSSFC